MHTNGITKSGILSVAGVEDHGTICAGCERPLSQYATRAGKDGIEVVRLSDNRYCSSGCEAVAKNQIELGKLYRASQREIIHREWVWPCVDGVTSTVAKESVTRRDGSVELI